MKFTIHDGARLSVGATPLCNCPDKYQVCLVMSGEDWTDGGGNHMGDPITLHVQRFNDEAEGRSREADWRLTVGWFNAMLAEIEEMKAAKAGKNPGKGWDRAAIRPRPEPSHGGYCDQDGRDAHDAREAAKAGKKYGV